MKKWLKKSAVVLVSVLTFGLVPPSHAIWNYLYKADNNIEQGSTETAANLSSRSNAVTERKLTDEEYSSQLVSEFLDEAEEQAYRKFGAKIRPVIEDEFCAVILPNIETAIAETVRNYPQEKLPLLAVSDQPSAGTGEKIFHIYNTETKEDVIRFHVRREHPPGDGYYFNFHYHVAFDNFQTHRHLGTIYWDKNMPPQWMKV
ncbi:cell division protein FtsK [Weizmannia acidilactici]|uniref:Cell division protein FtsK n=1 Tax=Weizmannia acidilactici TaxID=2607726 RepID=A0A5J4JLJ6_9BACI|nr:YpjP family protein [Weizmannia acidilactici]GER65732.1 cell division protein FtsK [Weizmannia acidilactici]GER71575.1 cell division protein FtsK [Weizmannia acidilactici]GER72088.1 cell division protein FtsK [Weizmannia acidilactici]